LSFHGTAPNIPEIEKAMTFNRETCPWTIAGEVPDVRTSEERKKILAAMTEIGKPATPTEIATIARMKVANVKRLIFKMTKAGLVNKVEYGQYVLATIG